MAKGGGGFTGKPVKGTMSGKEYGKAVSSAAKVMAADKKVAGMSHRPSDSVVAGAMRPITPKTPTTSKRKKSAY